MSTIKLPPLPEVRWNFDASETSLLVCRDDHDKGEKCEYEELHPAEALRVIDTLRSRVLQLEADRAQRGEPVLWRYRDSEQCIRPMDGYTPGEGWTPLYDNPQPERKHTDADLAAEYERGRKAGLTQAYDAALAQQERQSHTPETVRKIIEADRAQRGEPVAWRAWFDKDSGARWLFSLWPDEENKGLEVDWQPLYTAPQPERKPTTDAQCIELFHKVQRGMGFKDHDVIPFISGVAAGEHFHGIKETP